MLRITVNDEDNKVRIIVEGELSGDLAHVLEANWRNSAELQQKNKIVDLRGLTAVDVAGKRVLGLMMEDGAEFVVSGPKTAHLIETLRRECRRLRATRGAGKLTIVGAILLLLSALVMSAHPQRSSVRLNPNAPQATRSAS